MWCEYQANEMVVNRNNINQIKEIICIFCNELLHEMNTCKQCVYQANELLVYQNNKTKLYAYSNVNSETCGNINNNHIIEIKLMMIKRGLF